jgi:hypothetical protein
MDNLGFLCPSPFQIHSLPQNEILLKTEILKETIKNVNQVNKGKFKISSRLAVTNDFFFEIWRPRKQRQGQFFNNVKKCNTYMDIYYVCIYIYILLRANNPKDICLCSPRICIATKKNSHMLAAARNQIHDPRNQIH